MICKPRSSDRSVRTRCARAVPTVLLGLGIVSSLFSAQSPRWYDIGSANATNTGLEFLGNPPSLTNTTFVSSIGLFRYRIAATTNDGSNESKSNDSPAGHWFDRIGIGGDFYDPPLAGRDHPAVLSAQACALAGPVLALLGWLAAVGGARKKHRCHPGGLPLLVSAALQAVAPGLGRTPGPCSGAPGAACRRARMGEGFVAGGVAAGCFLGAACWWLLLSPPMARGEKDRGPSGSGPTPLAPGPDHDCDRDRDPEQQGSGTGEKEGPPTAPAAEHASWSTGLAPYEASYGIAEVDGSNKTATGGGVAADAAPPRVDAIHDDRIQPGSSGAGGNPRKRRASLGRLFSRTKRRATGSRSGASASADADADADANSIAGPIVALTGTEPEIESPGVA